MNQGKGGIYLLVSFTKFLHGHLMKWVKALFVKGVSIFLQLIAATAKCTGNQIKDVISTSAGTNGVRLALHVSLLSMMTNLYIMVLKKEIGKESLSLFWMLASDTTSHRQLYFRNVLIITLSCSSVQHHLRYYWIAFTSFSMCEAETTKNTKQGDTNLGF